MNTKENNKPKKLFKIQFNQILEKTITFDNEYAKNKVDRGMHYSKIVNTPDNRVDQNFAREFVNSIKELTFCSDQARVTLYIKDKDGKPVKKNANAFVSELFKIFRLKVRLDLERLLESKGFTNPYPHIEADSDYEYR